MNEQQHQININQQQEQININQQQDQVIQNQQQQEQISLNQQQQEQISLNQQQDQVILHQQLPIMVNAEQLNEEIPDRATQINVAYSEIHGNQRMTYKDKKRRNKRFDEKQKCSDHMHKELTQSVQDRERSIALIPENLRNERAGCSLARQAIAWLDAPVNEEIAQKNITRFNNLTCDDNDLLFEEANRVFDEFLAMDLNSITYETDYELSRNYAAKKNILQKGMEVNTLVKQVENQGMFIDISRKLQLQARASTCEQITMLFASKEGIINNPYYARLTKNDTRTLSIDELVNNAIHAEEQGNNELSKYYNALITYTEKFDRSISSQKYYKEYLEQKTKKYYKDKLDQRDVLENSQKTLDETWSPEAMNYKIINDNLLGPIDINGALVHAGLKDRVMTRSSVVIGIFLQKTEKKLNDPLDESDRMILEEVRLSVEGMLQNQNTKEKGADALVNMLRGVLQTPLSSLPIDNSESLAQNGPILLKLLNIVKDFEQIVAGNEDCGQMAMDMLTDDEKREITNISAFSTLMNGAISGAMQVVMHPNYDKILKGNFVPKENDTVLINNLASSKYLKAVQPQLTKIAQQKGRFQLPEGIQHTYTYVMMKENNLMPQDSQKEYALMDAKVVADIYGGLAL